MSKKIAAALLAVLMVAVMVPMAAFAVEFTDTNGHWGKDAIDRWAEVGVLNGKGGGKFDPNGSMTRAEFAQMLANMMGYTKKAANVFTDVPEDAWYADAVLKLLEAGVLQGEGNGLANPTGLITREQAAVMLCRAFGIKASPNASLTFQDKDKVSSWARDAVAALAERGMMNGVGNNTAAPQLNITRASVATLADNMIAEYVTESKTITGTVDGIILVAGDANVTIANAAVKEPVIVAPKAEGATVSFTGTTTAADVVVEADDVQVSVGQGATVSTVDVQGEDAKVAVSGTVDTVTTEAANTSVTGSGTVSKVEVGTGAANATVTTPSTDVENNSSTAVTIPDGTIGAGEDGTTPPASTPSGGGGGGGSTTPSKPANDANVVAAPIADHHATNAIDKSKLGTVSVSSTAVSGQENTYDVVITGTGIMKHDNANNVAGHWVGFGIPSAPAGETYSFYVDDSQTANATIAGRTFEAGGKTYNSVYISEEENGTYASHKITVKNGDEVVATYNVTCNVTFWKASNVSIDANVTDADDIAQVGKQNLIGKNGIEVDSISGLNMTLKGVVDKDKLNLGEYTYYVLHVKDDVITKVNNSAGAEGGFPTAADGTTMAVKVLDKTNNALLKSEHTFELKDAADRVQDTITVTVDATKCTVKGMNKVVFKDANGAVVSTLSAAQGGEVTAPAAPSSTDTVYYTGNWVIAGTEESVAAGGKITVGDTAEVVYTAENVPVTQTTLSVRTAGGENNHDPAVADFDYPTHYASAGISFDPATGKITVTEATMKAFVDAAKENEEQGKILEHLKGTGGEKANQIMFGIAYNTPASATKVGFAGNLDGLKSINKDSAGVRNLSGENVHNSVHNGNLISYIPVATITAEGNITFLAEGDSDYCKWMDDDGKIIAITKTVITLESK